MKEEYFKEEHFKEERLFYRHKIVGHLKIYFYS